MPAIILIVADGIRDRDRALDEVGQRAFYQSEQASQQMARLAEGMRNVLLALAREPVIIRFEAREAEKRFTDLMGQFDHVVNLGLTDARGMVVASGIPVAGPVDLSDRLYVRRAIKDNTFVCGAYQRGRITGVETLNFAYPVRDDSGHPLGVVYAAVDLRYFERVFDGITLVPEGDIAVVDADGRILYSRLRMMHRLGELFPLPSGVPGISGSASSLSITGPDAIRRIYSVQAVNGIEGLQVLVGVPVREAVAAAGRALKRQLMLLGMVTLCIMALAWVFGGLFIARRVDALIRLADEIAAGNLVARSGMVGRRGELGRLAGSFDRMAARLQMRDDELRESRKKFQALFDYSPVPLALSNVDDNCFMDVNRAFTALFGFTREDVLGATAAQLGLVDVSQQQECLEILTARGSLSAHPLVFRSKSGAALHVVWSADIIRMDGRACILSSAVDVTDLRTAEDAVRRSDALLRSAINQSSAFTGLLDTTGRVVYANQTSLDFIGLDLEDVAGRWFWECPWWPDRESARKMLTAAMHDALAGTMFRAEVEHVDKNGTRRVFDFTLSPLTDPDGSVAYLIPEGLDVTETREISRQLRQEMHFTRLLVDTSPALIVAIDTDGKVMMMNRVMLELLEYGAEEVAGLDYVNTFVPERERADMRALFDCLAHNTATTVNCNSIVSKTGAMYLIEWHGQSVQSDNGRPDFFVGVGIDITARREAEQEREIIQLQLTQAQKLESVGRLAGGVAHDFNNMLGVILGHTDLALGNMSEDHALYKHLTEVRKAAARSVDLTRQLLAFARKQAIAPRVLDLNATIAGMLAMLQRLIGEDSELVWHPGAHVWPVRLDPGQIDQVLANLCVNARDAIAHTGTVTIATATAVLNEAYCADHAGFVPGEFVLLTVSDTGCGMDQLTMAQIFEPFFTTKEPDSGTGLGLATVYGIVKQNSGFINVYSEPGQGTRFSLYFRRHDDASDPHPVEQSGVQHPAGGSETILLVEDEAAILRMAAQMLEQQGYRVLTAGSPVEAMRIAAEHAGKIQLLLTDIIMPEMTGRDLADRLLSSYPELRCLFMSGYTADVIVHRGMLGGGAGFLQKPFSQQDLAARVRSVLDM